MKPTQTATEKLYPSSFRRNTPPLNAKGYREDHVRGFFEGVVGLVEQQEDDQEH
jgi:hypothetical protein